MNQVLAKPSAHKSAFAGIKVVDVSELKFCDSVGLSAFVTSKQVIAARGGWLSFAGANGFLLNLLETVGLTRYFAIFPEVDDAIAAAQF